MKKRWVLFLVCVFSVWWGHPSLILSAFPSKPSDGFLVSLSGFTLGKFELKGAVYFNVKKSDEYSVYTIVTDDLVVGEVAFGKVEAKITRKNSEFTITYIKGKNFLVTGKVDFFKNNLLLNVSANNLLVRENMKGTLRSKMCVKGGLYKPWIKGTSYLKDGEYFGRKFSEAHLSYSGYMPYLRLSNSEVTLNSGSRFLLEGFVNMNDLSAMFSSSELSSKEVNLGGWKVFSRDNGGGFSKDIDDHMGVTFGGMINREDRPEQLGAEFRYQLAEDKFLKFRMEENKSIVGFEKRTEF